MAENTQKNVINVITWQKTHRKCDKCNYFQLITFITFAYVFSALFANSCIIWKWCRNPAKKQWNLHQLCNRPAKCKQTSKQWCQLTPDCIVHDARCLKVKWLWNRETFWICYWICIGVTITYFHPYLSPYLRCGVNQQPKNHCCRKFFQILTVHRDFELKEHWLILSILLMPGIAQLGHQWTPETNAWSGRKYQVSRQRHADMMPIAWLDHCVASRCMKVTEYGFHL